MQQTCKKYWKVVCGKETHIITKKQKNVLKKASIDGKRGLIWFKKNGKDKSISIAHIQSVSYYGKKQGHLIKKPKIEISKKERKKAKKKANNIRNNLKKILSMENKK